LNRRSFVKHAGVLPFAMGLPARGFASAQPQSDRTQPYSKTMPDMLVSYFVRKFNSLAAEWDEKRNKIHTPDEIAARSRFVREKTIEMVHGIPPRGPVKSVTVKKFDRDGYRVENVMLETRPDYWVPGNLYVPAGGDGPYPGILSPCGHEVLGRMYGPFQCAHASLARAGFVVWTYEPMEEGERRHFWNPQTGKNEIGGPVTWAHALEGQLLMLLGEDLTHYRIWDGMRGLDYLLSRPEVDRSRIGCTGQSGGGTFTMYLTALDDRIRCAATNEGGAENRWPLGASENFRLDIGDIDQEVFPAAIYGVDSADLHIAIAPRPLLVATGYFSPRFNETMEAIRARYRQLGAPEKFAVTASGDPHFWTVKLRLATTDWFCRWFYNRPGPTEEPPFEPEPPENLYCTVDGSVEYSRQGQTIFSLILKRQAELPPKHDTPKSQEAFEEFRRQIRSEITKALRLKQASTPLDPRPFVTTPRKGYRIEKIEFLSEPGIYVPTWVFVPDGYQGGKPAIVYASDSGLEQDGLEFEILDDLVSKGRVIVAVDVRGIGITTSSHPSDESPGQFRQVDDAEEVLTYWAWQMDECFFGMRVYDLLRTVEYALSRPDVDANGIMAIGRGMGALWALYAAALDDRIKYAICHDGLLSYRALTSVDRYTQETSVFVRDVLKYFDLPQVAAAAAGRHLTALEPAGPMKTPVEFGEATKAYDWTRQVFAAAGADGKFVVSTRNPELSLADQYWALLND
jgi:cephalosporin-C deacetylase-like acetyl esterase